MVFIVDGVLIEADNEKAAVEDYATRRWEGDKCIQLVQVGEVVYYVALKFVAKEFKSHATIA